MRSSRAASGRTAAWLPSRLYKDARRASTGGVSASPGGRSVSAACHWARAPPASPLRTSTSPSSERSCASLLRLLLLMSPFAVRAGIASRAAASASPIAPASSASRPRARAQARRSASFQPTTLRSRAISRAVESQPLRAALAAASRCPSKRNWSDRSSWAQAASSSHRLLPGSVAIRALAMRIAWRSCAIPAPSWPRLASSRPSARRATTAFSRIAVSLVHRSASTSSRSRWVIASSSWPVPSCASASQACDSISDFWRSALPGCAAASASVATSPLWNEALASAKRRCSISSVPRLLSA